MGEHGSISGYDDPHNESMVVNHEQIFESDSERLIVGEVEFPVVSHCANGKCRTSSAEGHCRHPAPQGLENLPSVREKLWERDKPRTQGEAD